MPDETASEGRTTWLSESFEKLAKELTTHVRPGQLDFDVVVIGSGYGGSVAAKVFSEQLKDGPLWGRRGSVCVLERGREYLQGMFPNGVGEVPEHIRFSSDGQAARGMRTGLFDFRLDEDVAALVANGLGGGSLINAGVLAKPDFDIVQGEHWPSAFKKETDTAWNVWCKKASTALGARTGVADLGKRAPFMRAITGGTYEDLEVSIASKDCKSTAGVELRACIKCGDCATGCNYGAKESLDTNLLVDAQRNGARLFTSATVEKLERRKDGAWVLHVNHTDTKLRRRQGEPLKLVAKRVVVAAGVYGSTELLLRSQSETLHFSKRLGHRFSANGDALATIVDLKEQVNAVAMERRAAGSRQVGPTITNMVRVRAVEATDSFVIQDLAVPAALSRIFLEATALSRGFHDLAIGDDGDHKPDDCDPCAVNPAKTKHTLLIALIGHDNANGRIALTDEDEQKDAGRGVRVIWPEARTDKRLDDRHKKLEQMLKGERLFPNPLWRVFPQDMEFLFQSARGPILTTHPLGGCPMGDNADSGVVDHFGRVFSGDGTVPESVTVHEGLAVLDGSIVPTSLGINPALTITALAMRAADSLAPAWFRPSKALSLYGGAPAREATTPVDSRRPCFRKLNPAITARKIRTRVEVVERLYGTARSAPFSDKPFNVELTLQFKPAAIADLVSPDPAKRKFTIDPNHSRLRLFDTAVWDHYRDFADEEPPDEKAFLIAPIESGSLKLLQRERSRAWDRGWRGFFAWWPNRGLRDSWQRVQDWYDGVPVEPTEDKRRLWRFLKRMGSSRRLTTLAGEVRQLEYELVLGERSHPAPDLAPSIKGVKLGAVKRLTYGRRSNPWEQLMTASWTAGPLRGAGGGADLTLHLRHLEKRGIPLIRVVDQEDQVSATLDMSALLLYLMRVILRIHTWSFRKPDPRPREAPEPRRLPSEPRGMRIQKVYEVPLAAPPGAPPEPSASLRLTRFATKQGGHGTPVLMIHGYSTSGSTFAHHTAPSLARALWNAGWDPWVVDLRTSAAMPTACHRWSFEQVGYADIPVAIETILGESTYDKVHVIAHCMGSAMTCMALLGDFPEDKTRSLYPAIDYEPPDPYPALRKQMRTKIASLVLSQVTPYTLYTPGNVMRAYLLRYFPTFVTTADYSFRVEYPASIGDQLLDRLLHTLPYPKREFDYTNPPWWRGMGRTPWTATRHRMDALYGRDFSVRHLGDDVLEHIDDLFGPLNLGTASQGSHLARRRVLVDRMGVGRFVTHDRLRERMKMPILSLHGAENGLVDVSTAHYMRRVYERMDDGVRREARILKGFGHQDSLIGVRAEDEVFPVVLAFLDDVRNEKSATVEKPEYAVEPPPHVRAELPPYGVGLGKIDAKAVAVHINNRIHYMDVDAIAMVPVRTIGDLLEAVPGKMEIACHVGLGWVAGSGATPSASPTDLSVPRYLWGYGDGVLFVQLTGPFDDKRYKKDIEKSVEKLLALGNAKRCMIPSRAIVDRPESPPDFCFALGSCQYTPGITDGTPRVNDMLPIPGPADKSYARLGERLRPEAEGPKPELLIMAGDNVYVDATAGLFDPSVEDGRYLNPYERLFGSVYLQDITRQIPVCALIDDHEIEDNWEGNGNPSTRTALTLGQRSYHAYLRAGSLLDAPRPLARNKLCAAFERGGFQFFVADTRTDREPRVANDVDRKHIMSGRQRAALRMWLKRTKSPDPNVPTKPRFIVTSSIVLPRRLSCAQGDGSLHSDAWDGYPASLDWLLDVLAKHGDNVVLLSGDEHMCITATATSAKVVVRSIHSSGTYTPYPFANALREDLALNEPGFTSQPSGRKWQVTSTVHTGGQGFALLALKYEGGAWKLTVTFDLEGAADPPEKDFTF